MPFISERIRSFHELDKIDENSTLVSISSWGNIGNRMIELIAALKLINFIPGKIVINVNLPEWDLYFYSNLHNFLLNENEHVFNVLDRDVTSWFSIADAFYHSKKKFLTLEGCFQRYCL